MTLWNAYEANEVAADEVYKNRTLLVTGAVSSIDKDFTGDIIVELTGGNMFMGLRAHLEDSEKSKAASLAKGTKVRLQCTGAGKIVGSPVLNDCTFKS